MEITPEKNEAVFAISTEAFAKALHFMKSGEKKRRRGKVERISGLAAPNELFIIRGKKTSRK